MKNFSEFISEASAKMAEMMYAEQAAKAQENAEPSSNEANVNSENDADVVDAEYKEVNNDKK